MLRSHSTKRRSTECSRLPHGWAFLFASGLLVLSLLTTIAHAASLSQLAEDALAHDATLASAEASYRASLEKEPEARAALLPHLGFAQSDFKNSIHVPGQPAAPYSTVGATLSLNQTLFRWDDWQSYQESKLSVIGAGFIFTSAKQDLLLRVAQAYFDSLAAKDTFELAQEHLRSVDEQLGLTRRSFALGAATVVDLDEAQAASDSAHADLLKAQSELARRYAALQKIVGHSVDAVEPLDADASLATFTPKFVRYVGSGCPNFRTGRQTAADCA
jgi:outer membrane protein